MSLHPVFADILAAHGAPAERTPPCRVCGKTEGVACYWPDAPGKAICVECCPSAEHEDGETGHGFDYDRAERDRVCRYCGEFARNTDYYDRWED